MRLEPPPSVPMCSTPAPAAAATTAPPDEPPGVVCGFQGLRVTPVNGLSVIAAQSLTQTISLIVVGTPSIADKGAPLRQRAVDSLAMASAASAAISEKALY